METEDLLKAESEGMANGDLFPDVKQVPDCQVHGFLRDVAWRCFNQMR